MSTPDTFCAFIGGHMGPSYKVEFASDVLTYTRMSRGYEEEEVVAIEPTDDDWRAFTKTLDELDIWSWEEHYPNHSGICDGTHWRIQLEFGGRTLESSGTNNYPSVETTTDRSPFNTFKNALEALLGGREFR